jgi:hypothetical protein
MENRIKNMLENASIFNDAADDLGKLGRKTSIYLLYSDSERVVKIGISTAPKRRLMNIRLKTGISDFKIVDSWMVSSRSRALFIEKQSHQVFSDDLSESHVGKEIFRAADGSAKFRIFIDDAAQKTGSLYDKDQFEADLRTKMDSRADAINIDGPLFDSTEDIIKNSNIRPHIKDIIQAALLGGAPNGRRINCHIPGIQLVPRSPASVCDRACMPLHGSFETNRRVSLLVCLGANIRPSRGRWFGSLLTQNGHLSTR